MAKIVTLGEIMLRLSPNGNDRFIQSESFRMVTTVSSRVNLSELSPVAVKPTLLSQWLTMVTRHIS